MPILKKDGFRMTKILTDNENVTPNIISVTNEINRKTEALRIYYADINESVINLSAVYYDSTSDQFLEAVADGTIKQEIIGISDTTNSEVITFGIVEDIVGFNDGDIIYLSTTIPGSLTSVKPESNIVKVGMIMYNTNKQKLILFVNIQFGTI